MCAHTRVAALVAVLVPDGAGVAPLILRPAGAQLGPGGIFLLHTHHATG